MDTFYKTQQIKTKRSKYNVIVRPDGMFVEKSEYYTAGRSNLKAIETNSKQLQHNSFYPFINVPEIMQRSEPRF